MVCSDGRQSDSRVLAFNDVRVRAPDVRVSTYVVSTDDKRLDALHGSNAVCKKQWSKGRVHSGECANTGERCIHVCRSQMIELLSACWTVRT